VGIGTVTGCLSAIRTHVYERGTAFMNDLVTALATDFRGRGTGTPGRASPTVSPAAGTVRRAWRIPGSSSRRRAAGS
jgi:hypothetical protein